jgi:prepilin-type N-terminal cleavage/methylation domain-containing protein
MHRLNHSVRRRLCKQEGFTLFEIIMVLLILGVLSYFIATRLFSADAPTQNAEMDLVKNHLRYAQSRAMNTEPPTGYTNVWGIKFGSSTRYWLYREPNDNTIVRLPGVESSDGAVVLNNIQISWSSPATEKVAFDSFGSPGSSTLPYTVQPKGGGSALGTIYVTKNTGFIP